MSPPTRAHARSKGSASPGRRVGTGTAKATTSRSTATKKRAPAPRRATVASSASTRSPVRTSSRPGGTSRPAGTTGTRRRPSQPSTSARSTHRRSRSSRRIPLAVAFIIAATIVGTSFPASALLAQHHQLSADGQPATTARGTGSLGDPGAQPLVSPANAPDMTPDPGNPSTGTTLGSSSGTASTTTTLPASSSTTDSGGGGFWHRVSSTLEFWR